jgi:hypothetical protein
MFVSHRKQFEIDLFERERLLKRIKECERDITHVKQIKSGRHPIIKHNILKNNRYLCEKIFGVTSDIEVDIQTLKDVERNFHGSPEFTGTVTMSGAGCKL